MNAATHAPEATRGETAAAGGARTEAPGVVTGLGIGRGGAVGPIAVLRPSPSIPADSRALDDAGQAADAAEAAEAALAAVAAELDERAGGAEGPLAAVLTATAGMARDTALRKAVRARIQAGTSAAAAVDDAAGQFAAMFTAAGGKLAERVTDLRSVRDRAVARLLGRPAPGLGELAQASVIAAHDLSPADTASLDLSCVAAIVTEAGGPTGHTAIIAGQLGIPCIVRAQGATSIPEGTVVAVDAAAGTVTVDPDDDLVAALSRRADDDVLLAADHAPGATLDGHPVALLANIGTPEDAEALTDAAVEGVGLFRTEVLFLDAPTAPSRAEQAPSYARAVEALGGRKLVVRTLDAGADKPLAFANRPGEENPALGVRGYRLVRTLPQLLEEQLAALGEAVRALPAGQRRTVWAMAPMVATPAEARSFARLAHAHGIEQVGVMVEVPAAALRAKDILAEVDFVSIGTNDLAQYTMATDRLRGELSDLTDPWQPAVLDLVAATADAGRRAHKPVGVCGESAADPLLAIVLAGLGIGSLSMSPAAVPAVRFALRHHTLARCEQVAAAVLSSLSATEARAAARALAVPEVIERLGL